MALRFLVVDDERLSRDYLTDLILEVEPDAMVQTAASGAEAIPLLEEGRIDILFLDIMMPGMDGFGLLDRVPQRTFELVFITAHNEHAIKAIREDAADYLLKPVKKTDFKAMLQRVAARHAGRVQARMPYLDVDRLLGQKLSLTHQQGLRIVTLKDIVCLKADNSYTTLVLSDGLKVTTSKPIGRFEQTLPAPLFFRIHKTYIINLAHFREYLSKDGDVAVMDNGDKLTISRYRLGPFLDVLRELAGTLQL